MREVNAGSELINKILELCDLPQLEPGVDYAQITVDTNGRLTLTTDGVVLKPETVEGE